MLRPALLVVAALAGGLSSPCQEDPDAEEPARAAPFDAVGLRCQHLVAPRGLDVLRPRLSWQLRATDPGARGLAQSAYHVLVASAPERLRPGSVDLWDSGRVASTDSAVRYAGAELRAHGRCFWRVRAFDAAGRPSAWSEVATFTMGMLEPGDWQARWIGYDAPLQDVDGVGLRGASWIWFHGDPPGRVPEGAQRYFRGTLRLSAGELESAELNVTADDAFSLWINGELVVTRGDGIDDAWKRPVAFDCTQNLREGDNLVAVAAANISGPAGLIARLRAKPRRGEPIDWVTDATWRCADAAPEGWNAPGFADAEWPVARVVGSLGDAPWGDVRVGGLLLPPPRYLRREFAVDGGLERATLYASALGLYRLRLNGERVGDDWFAPGWTDYGRRVYSRAYDVTELLRRGDNALGAVLADGWYAGYVGYKPARHHYGERTRLLAQLRLQYADGRVATVVTDGSWRASTGPLREADFLMGERCDARLWQEGWDRPGFAGETWQPVDVDDGVKASVQAHPSQPVRAITEVRAQSVAEPSAGAWVFDFGQNLAGVVRLTLRGTRPGQEITLRSCERVNPDGTVYMANLRAARCTDVYICRGAPTEIWTPAFTFHGFQYVEVQGLDGKPPLDTVVALALSSDVPVAGSLECSDPMVNRLFQNIRWTQAANFIDVPTDCPQRDERLGWTGDAQVYVRTACYLSDVRAFFGKWLVDLRDAQRHDGQFPMVAPLKVAGDDGGPAWADAGVIVPWAIYEVYGDAEVLERSYDAMARFISFCEGRSRDDGLPPEEFHCFGDWVNIGDDTPKEVIYTAYFAHSVDLMARAATALGRESDAARYRELFARIVAAFNREFVDDAGKIRGHSQCAYVMALAFGLVDGERRARAAAHLIERIESRDWHLSTGFVGTKDLMLVLSAIGRDDVAYRLLHNRTFPSWGFTIENGATSIWERWNGWTPEQGFANPGMNSFAHYAFGAVGQWMFENIGGIRPLQPGFASVLIRPRPGGELSWAKVSYESVRGRIATEWRRSDDGFELDIQVPVNTTAEVHVPCPAAGEVSEGGGSIAAAAGVEFLRRGRDAVVVQVGSGSYRFAVR